MSKELGCIQSVRFGWGGYQDCMLGFSFKLGGSDWGVHDFWGAWGTERTSYTEWSEESRIALLGEACMKIKDLMKKAKVQSLDGLINMPVEATFENVKLQSWRILEEVIA